MTRNEADQCVILKVLVGSHIHGLNVPESDKDYNAIIVEPIEEALTVGTSFEELVVESEEEDVTYTSLRKWCRLALGGNPNFLLPLYAPDGYIVGHRDAGLRLRELRGCFVSKAVGKAHLGYMHNQRKRMLGQLGNGGHGQQRKDLVEKYGFDTKFGMHLLRLGIQGVEFLLRGSITLPLPDAERELLLDVRRGEVPMVDVLEHATALEDHMKRLLEKSSLPEQPDREAVGRFMRETYMEVWNGMGS
jgi:hypothetical protein